MHEHADRDHTEPRLLDPDIGEAGGARAGNPLHGMPATRDAAQDVPSDDGRRTRYAEACQPWEAFTASDGDRSVGMRTPEEIARAVMAVADAEQVELRCELALANVEAEAAEAVIARVEALHHNRGYNGTAVCNECGRGVVWPCPTAVALAGPAEPEATEGGTRG